MTRLMLLDRGEELSEMNHQELSSAHSPVRLRLLEPSPPFRQGEIVQVRQVGAGATRSHNLLLCRDGGVFRLRPLQAGRAGDTQKAVGRIVAIERGPVTFSLERGLLAHLPASWLPRAIDALEVFGRFRHPFTPSLYLGSAETCLAGVREKYNREAEVGAYSRFVPTELEAFEWELLERHVKPRGRVLDIGCGAGREALNFARAGFRVVAIDIAPRMIEAARRHAEREGLDITFKVQSATELDEPPGSFDGAYWAGSYHHVPGRALRIETLRRVVRILTPDGVLILMVVYPMKRGLLSRSRLVDLSRRAARRLLGAKRVSEPGDGYMREVSEASDPREAVFFHDFFDPQEVGAELGAAGLCAEEMNRGWWVCRRHLPD